ncbi:MAG: hypothetical protein JWM42_240, partial [Burkholderia sp.]|nr:hypothetical protein [Burkholderia sp.]
NAGFVLAGIWGMLRLWPMRRRPELAAGWPGYSLFMIALVLTAVGSAFYHLAPDNDRLVWDRLPIVFACAGLLAGVRAGNGPRINGWLWTCVLAIAGALSVGWWHLTGDLRFYLLLQVLPLVLIPLWQAIHGAPHDQRIVFAMAIILYALAKAAELSDHALFSALGWMSGHTIKHLLATAAAAAVVVHLVRHVSPRHPLFRIRRTRNGTEASRSS